MKLHHSRVVTVLYSIAPPWNFSYVTSLSLYFSLWSHRHTHIPPHTMSGVWIFDKNGVARLITNPTRESFEQKEPPYPGTATSPGARPRVLVYLPANQVIRSYTQLEQCLTELGWSRYHNSGCSNLLQFHRSENSAHLISLPKNFANFKTLHMYDIVVKNRSFFEVRDATACWHR